ncbi:DUF2243 domain-containing protein [Streptomyces sp. ISL-22]|uniref:DUF2243 domain-containing protein n=1 Tax=unclassified Streptomyces TaxID=2593676 RepID=UPI001BE65250|nr:MULTISPECIES: DUF2243 domain-containing protein [unclassified Streptomyces]MBT2420277.1 DUF2243 domain-containing protein [Streptomyces sp. ISL-24]MBT2433109.1 DUF2243 domain-containing protein [Streptomyces sp. ISL-22]
MTSEPTPAAPREGRLQPRRSLAVCALIGAAVMAAVDEIVFHQVLHWHHFYDRSTPGIALLSDGLLHTGELLALVAGFFLFADLRRRHALAPAHARAGFFLGLGGFQLFDGVVDHKLLRLHQIRYGVDVTPYDWGWNLAGLVFLLVGISLTVHATRHAPDGTART